MLLPLALHLVYSLQLLTNLALQVSPLGLVDPRLLDDLGPPLDHQHLSVHLLLPVSVPLHVVQPRQQDVVYPRETALAQIALLGDRGRVLHRTALISLRQIFVIGLGKTVGQVVQLLRQADRLHQLLVRLVHLEGLQMQFFHLLLDERGRKDLLRRGARLGLLLQHQFDHMGELLRVLLVDGRIDAQSYSLEQALHVFRLKGRLQSGHLVNHTSQRPNVRLAVVRLVLPHLRTRVIRRPCLRIQQAVFCHLRHIEVTELGLASLGQEDIGALNGTVVTLRSR